LQEVNNALPDLRLNWYDWWLSPSVQTVAGKHNLQPSHANWLEAFSFTIVAAMPDGIKTPPHIPSAIMDAKTARAVYGDGSFGGAYRAPEDVMQEIFTACLDDVLRLLEFE
jgi:hypothetical protein